MAITRIGNIASTIPDSSVQNVKMSNIVQSKNIIINGSMDIAQRATSVSSISSGNTIHTCDRWKTYASSAGTWTQTQEALTSGDPYTNGFATSLKLDCTTANGSLSSGSYLQIAQSIEAQNLQYIKKGTSNAEQLTASFWVKSTKTGTNILQFVSLDNTVRICAKSYTINSSDTLEKKTITIPADTSSTGKIDNNNGEGMRMIFWVAAGTDYTSGTLATTWQNTNNPDRAVGQINNADSTSNNFEITGVQLEAGTSASEFEFLPFDVNLQRCHRYCLILGDAPGGSTYEYADNGVIGHYYNTTDFYPNWFYPVPMRGTPGVSFSTTGSGLGDVSSQNTAKTGTSAGTNATSSTNINFRVSTASATQGSGGAFNFAASNYVILSAEL